MIDRSVVIGSALVAAAFAIISAVTSTNAGIHQTGVVPSDEPEAILDQVHFPPPEPLSQILEIDILGNIIVAIEADAVVTHDGGPDGPIIAGMDIRGSRCSRSVFSVMARSAGPWTVICLPREFGLYERVNALPPLGGPVEP